jgi:DNA-binding response OmpR family regulator
MDSRPMVLIADDEPAAARLVARSLSVEGFHVSTASDGASAIERVWEVHPDVLLLDVNMPGMSGFDVLRELKDTHPVRVIFITGQESVAAAREGLDLGAEDYIRKPFSGPELAARIRAVLRRRHHLLRGRRRIGAAMADLDNDRILVDGKEIELPRKEWLLLERLIAADGGVVTHDELLMAAFGPAYLGDAAYLRLWIGQLRRRLGVPAWDEGPIRTVPGLGYMLDPGGKVPVRRTRRPKDDAMKAGTKQDGAKATRRRQPTEAAPAQPEAGP